MRLEARVDERNQQIAELKRARDDEPKPPHVAARTASISYTQSKPL
jgi:hypothetical protein